MSSTSLARVNSQDQTPYWTDDIPVCHLSAVGISNNQIYRENAPTRREEHECEDSCFRFRPESDKEIFLYGVFDGHNGSTLANFAAQRFPAEILLGQLSNKLDDNDEILNVLNQAFASVEKAYLDSISDQLAQKCHLQEQLPTLDGVNTPDAVQLYNDVVAKINQLEAEISGGTSAILALVIRDKLYVAGVGCCRALLCKIDASGVLRVNQLTLEHDIYNEEEIQRLANLGIDIDKLKESAVSSKFPYTRTIGDYHTKIGYRDIGIFSTATSEPFTAEPEMTEAIDLDDSCCFLILMSSGVCRSLEAAGHRNPNVGVASLVANEFAVQSTLTGVAQGVVDKIARMHHDAYDMTSDSRQREICSKREDMTILIRNFNYRLPNSANNSSSTGSPLKPLNLSREAPQSPLSVIIPTNNSPASGAEDHRPMFTVGSLQNLSASLTNTLGSMQLSSTYTNSNDSTQSGEDSGRLFQKQSQIKERIPLDSDGKVQAYVSFKGFEAFMEKMADEELEAFHKETAPRPDYETIPEEQEVTTPSSPPVSELYDNINNG